MAAETSGALTGGRPLRDSLYGDMVWSRPGLLRRELRLEAGSELLACLRWPKLFSFEAIAESGDGRWVIRQRRVGPLLGTCVMSEAGAGTEVASFKRAWRRPGVLRLASGGEYTWEHVGFWRRIHVWSSARQPRLITFRSVFSLTQRVEMEVDPAARQIDELPALVLMGAYLMALAAAERHAASSA
jgi:hypothetical protein